MSSLLDSSTIQFASFYILIMRKSIKKGIGKLRSKFGSSPSRSPAPPRITHNTGSQPLQRGPKPANEAPSDPNIAQSGAIVANITPSPLISPPAQSEEVAKDVSPSAVSAWDVSKAAMMTTLKVIKETSGALPPLQAAVGALVPIVEIIQVCRLFGIALSAAQ